MLRESAAGSGGTTERRHKVNWSPGYHEAFSVVTKPASMYTQRFSGWVIFTAARRLAL